MHVITQNSFDCEFRTTARNSTKHTQGSETRYSTTRASFATSRMNYGMTGRRQVMIDPNIKELSKSSKTDIQVFKQRRNGLQIFLKYFAITIIVRDSSLYRRI